MLAALLILAQAATAAPSTEQADARCVAAFGAMATSDVPDTQRAAQMGALYFYGKLVGRRPGVELKRVLLDATQAVSASPKAELTRCGSELQQAGLTMQAAGEAIAKEAGATPRPGATPTPKPSPTSKARR